MITLTQLWGVAIISGLLGLVIGQFVYMPVEKGAVRKLKFLLSLYKA